MLQWTQSLIYPACRSEWVEKLIPRFKKTFAQLFRKANFPENSMARPKSDLYSVI
jgi:hypothetical protein